MQQSVTTVRLKMKVLKNVLLFLIVSNVECAKILGIFNVPSKSHYILGRSLLTGLAAKGHEVYMLSPFENKKKMPNNYKEIPITDILKIKDEIMSRSMLEMQNSWTIMRTIELLNRLNAVDDFFLSHPITKSMINSKMQYDVAIVTWYGNDAILALAQRLAKHTIIFSTSGSYYRITELTRAPAPSSYVPDLHTSLTDEMTFMERLQNLLTYALLVLSDLILKYHQTVMINKHLPNTTMDSVFKNVSLMLLNTHYSTESPRPYVPQMIQVGGLHLEEPDELTGELKKLMEESNGVILFILGSNINSADFGKEKLDGIIRCFSKLPYRILWKYEKDDLKLPENVNVSKWLSQKDLLAHKNTKLFITHGGLLSTTEALYYGVPMIGIPFFADQEKNVKDGAAKGYLVPVQYSKLSERTLCAAIEEVLYNPKYQNNIKKYSKIFKDQPLKPLDRAIYWVEYVLRHDGAHHLKTNALKLNWFQLYSFDVFGAIFVVFVGSFYVTAKIVTFFGRCFCKKYTKNNETKLEQKFKVT